MAIHDKVLNTVSLEFSAIARAMSGNNSEMISLGLGEPSFPTPPAIIEAAHQSMLRGETRYSSPWGIPDLLSKISEKIYHDSGIQPLQNEIIVTFGAKQALSLVLTALLEPEDEIIVLSPCFVSFVPQVYMAEPKAKLVEFTLSKDNFSIDFDNLKKVINAKTKAIILNYPNNPTGYIPPDREIDLLVTLCKENNVHIISDEIYSSITLSDSGFKSLASYRNEYSNISIIDGFSKAYSMTGWRIGYLYGSKEIITRVSKLQQHLNTNIPVFIQRGALAALNLDGSVLNDYINQLKTNENCLYQMTNQIQHLHYVRSKGGMFSFINISKIKMTSDKFCSALLNSKHVACTPGIIFGKNWDDHIRISLGGDVEEFAIAMERICEFVEEVSE
jgi:aspartate aminotransferase